MTAGGIAGGILGGVIGYFAGGPYGAVQGAFLGSSLGMTVGSAVDPPVGRLGDTQYSRQDIYYNTTAHNLPVPVVYGINRVAGNLLWLGNVWVDVQESSGGGKEGGSGGGNKGGSQGQQQATVYVDFAIALSEGEIAALTELFIGDKRITETSGLTYTVYLGTNVQSADPRIVKDLGALAPTFRNTAYVVLGGSVGNYPSIPNVNAEIIGRYATELPSSFTLVDSSVPSTSATYSGYLGVRNLGAASNFNVSLAWADDEPPPPPEGGEPGIVCWRYSNAYGYAWLPLDTLADGTTYPLNPLPQDFTLRASEGGEGIVTDPFTITSEGITIGYLYYYDWTTDPRTLYPNVDLDQAITISDVDSGVSARLLQPDDTVVATGGESGRSITLTINHDLFTMPTSGYVQLYRDGPGYADPVAEWRWPSTDYAQIAGYSTFGFQRRYSWGNPVTIIEDILTNPRYGVDIDPARIDRASFTAAFSYCAGQVPYRTATNTIGWEPRFCLDYVMDAQAQVLDHLRSMLATCGGFLTWSQGTVKLYIEQPGATIAQSFGMHEIVADSFRWKRQSYRERPNVVRIEYVEPGTISSGSTEGRATDSPATLIDPYWGSQQLVDLIKHQGDTMVPGQYYKSEYKVYRQDFVEACDVWDIDRTGERRDKTYNLTGIKRRTQAQRMAYYYLNKAIFCSHACAFRVGAGALRAEVGDVIAVSHDIPRWEGKLFRIAEIQDAENDELTLGCLEHSEAVYADLSPDTPHGQNTLFGQASGQGGQPVNIARFSAYERPYEDTVEFSYTRVATRDFFNGTDIYIQRGGDWLGIGESVISNGPTAYLQSTINTMTFVSSGDEAQYSDPIIVRGVPAGYSARLYRPQFGGGGTLDAECVASGGTIVLTPSAITPMSGWIVLYSDGSSYSTVVPAGQWFGEYPGYHHASYPAQYESYPYNNTGTLRGGDIYDLQRVPVVLSATQSWIPIDRPLGGWTSGESLRIEREEISYTTFTDSMLVGVRRGTHDTPAVSHTGIVSLGMVAIYSGTADPPADVTAAFRDPLTNVEFLGGNSTWLYVGAQSKFSALNLWLARAASHPLRFYGEYSTAPGSWCSMTRSYFPAPIDTTSGLQWHGQISWEPWGDWTPVHETVLGGLNIGDATDRFYVRLLRVASLCVTPPQELDLTLTNDVLVVARKPGAFLYDLTLQDSGQLLNFKAVSRSIGGLAGDSLAAPLTSLDNTT